MRARISLLLAVLLPSLPALAQQATPFQARPDTVICMRNTSITITPLDNDLLGGPQGQGALVVAFTQPDQGTVVLVNQIDTFEFIPEDDFLGTTSFTYTIAPASGDLRTTSTARVTVQVLDLAQLGGSWSAPIANCDQQNRCTLSADLTVFNLGSRCSCPVGVAFYLSDDTKLDRRDRKIGKSLIGSVGVPEGTLNVTLTRRFSGLNPVGKFLIAKIDYSDRVFEIDESDNTVESPAVLPAR